MRIPGSLGRAALALAAALLFHAPAVFGGRIFAERDTLRTIYALFGYWADRIRSGRFPEWFPYDGLGQPYVGTTVSAAFHPAHLLWLVLPPTTALTWVTVGSSLMALTGACALGQSLGLRRSAAALAGVSFAFCGYLACIANNTEYLLSAAAIPWALWAAAELAAKGGWGRGARAALLLALVLFSGDPQGFFVTAALSFPLAFSRARAGRWARALGEAVAVVLVSALASAVQLSATWGAGQGRRLLSTEEALRWSLHPLQLGELALGPLFAADPGSDAGKSICRDLLQTGMSTLWVGSVHMGVLVLALAAAGAWAYRRHRATRFLAAVVAVLLLLVLGRYGGVYPVLHRLPVWSAFRYPVKLLPWLCLALALAAGAGLGAWEDSPRGRTRWAWGLLGAGALCGVLGLADHLGGGWVGPLLAPRWSHPPASALQAVRDSAFGAFVSSAAALALAGAIARWAPDAYRGALWVGLVFASLLWSNARCVGTVPAEQLTSPPPLLARVLRDEGGPRLGGPRLLRITGKYVPRGPGESRAEHFAAATLHAVEADVGALWGVETANAYLPANPAAYTDLASDELDFALHAAPAFGARYAIASAAEVPALREGWEAVEEDAPWGLTLLRARQSNPRAYLARPRCVPDALTARVMMRHPGFDVRNEALVECHTPPPDDAPIVGRVDIRADAPEEVELVSDADRPAVLVLSDAFAPGWSAQIDGAVTEVLLANGSARAVFVPAGRHEVRFAYRAPGLRSFGALSAATCVALLGLVALGGRRRAA